MASPAKTSSSSSSITCRTNPNMKKSELCDPMRRSFSGNPFTKPSVITNPRAFSPNTPVNSPSDFHRRHSTGRESVASDKENSKDQNAKPTKVRSPAISKGKKNFMSPTISAASKINASPKKKILVERNEPVRSSVSFSDVKSLIMEDSESTLETALKQKKVSFSDVKSVIMKDESTPEIGLNQKKVSFSDVKSVIMEDNESTAEISLNQKKVSFADVKSEVMEDNESTAQIALKQKKLSFSDVKSVIMKDESTPEIGLNQKKVSFSDVKSVIREDNESTAEISLNQKKVSFADVKSEVMEDNESTAQIGLKHKNFEVPHDSQSSNHEREEPLKSNADFDCKESNNDSDSLLETVTGEKDSVNVDPSFKISPRVSIAPSCPVLAPLDADPLTLPYDPKTNYLSPRPQFIHYKPNPRIGLYGEREGKQLEEHFASESSSDTDVTEEIQSEGSQRESEDISSEETMKEGEEEEKLQVSEPNPIAPNMIEDKFEAKRVSKPHFSTRSKFIALLLVLAFAYFSVIVANSPAFTPSGLEELSLSYFQVPPEVIEFAKANFDWFTQNLQHWSTSFLSSVSNIISSSRGLHKLGPFQYANFSHLLEDHMIEGHLMFDQSVMEPVRERCAGTEPFDNKYYRDIKADEAVDEDPFQDHMIEGMFDHSVMEPVRERDAGTELFDNKYYREIQADEAVDEDEEQEDQENEAYGNLELVSEEEPDEVQQGIEPEMIELDQLEEDPFQDHMIEGHLMFDHSVMKLVRERDAGTELFDSKYYREIQADEAVDEDEEQEVQENEAYRNLERVSEEEPDEVQQGIEPEMIELDQLEEDPFQDHMIEGHLMFDHSVMQPVRERDAGTELFYNKYYREIQADEAVDEDEEQDQENEAYGNLELVSEEPDEVQEGIEAEMIGLDQLKAKESKGVEFAAQIDSEHQSNVDLKNQPSIIPQVTEIQHDISKTGEPEGDDSNNIAETVFPTEEVRSDNLKIEDSTDNYQSSEVVDSTINGAEDQFLTKNVMGFSLLLLCLLAASAFIYTKRGEPSMPNAAVPVEPAVLAKKSYSPVSVSSKDTIHERSSSRNWQTELDMANESCPSETNSCPRTSSSYSKNGLKESNEYQSQERKLRKTYRRESLASSDYSMGSFTTYEKIPSKHGGEDEEIVTPVRRSKRIRNQITSP
ncbi:hypothetical protein CRYUN_Cryun10bG0106500 [Craigia yunnanensis]